MINIEKKIFRIDEDNREIWFYRYIMNSLFSLDTERYIEIYKKNKIEEDITNTVNELIKVANIHRSIVNSLDNTFMITKRYGEKIFMNLRNLIYKYRGFE